jgi:hypothetical protein
MEVNLDGRGMCGACINGNHRKPGETASAVILEGQTTLCNRPCHLPASALKGPATKKHESRAEQTRIDVGTIFIGAKS